MIWKIESSTSLPTLAGSQSGSQAFVSPADRNDVYAGSPDSMLWILVQGMVGGGGGVINGIGGNAVPCLLNARVPTTDPDLLAFGLV